MAFRLSARAGRAIAATAGLILAFDAAYAAANWTVSLTSGTTGGEAQAASVQNLTITASASPAAGNLLYPGGNGDVVASISNPNAFPVTITALQLPADTVYATGYTDSALATAATGCDSTSSTVTWNLSTATSGTSVQLTTALVVPAEAANVAGSLVVTLTDEAVMGAGAPSACEGKYFSMPALIGVTATGGAATATTSPTTDTY
ncbi:MAG TPA: hypothetical protein VFN68_13735 [Acidimicrobiales bacterium]|nr:hypothetical protein [Acidimicrobiales bacterium]